MHVNAATHSRRNQYCGISRISEISGMWKESLEIRKSVITEILGTIEDIWQNPNLNSNNINSINEGTYLSSIIPQIS
jgi:hypothetical protein